MRAGVLLSCTGVATMRTGGEDLGLALLLMGVMPVWDHGSARVTGVEVMALAELDRPRVDVTIRISGLFRDAFEAQIGLFDTAVQAVAASDAKSPAILDTLGLAYFMTGDRASALETQRKAVSLLPPGDSPTRTALEKRLAEFEADESGS